MSALSDRIKDFFTNIYALPQDCLEELTLHCHYLEYPKNFILLKQGCIAHQVWFLVQGTARYYYTREDGKEVNTWFAFENDPLTDIAGLIREHPSWEGIQLLEDSQLISISYVIIQSLLKKYHSFALWYLQLIEKYYIIHTEERLSDLQFLSATERYQKLLESFPDITRRVSLGHIASYLNITQETLSRIRAGKP